MFYLKGDMADQDTLIPKTLCNRQRESPPQSHNRHLESHNCINHSNL